MRLERAKTLESSVLNRRVMKGSRRAGLVLVDVFVIPNFVFESPYNGNPCGKDGDPEDVGLTEAESEQAQQKEHNTLKESILLRPFQTVEIEMK